MAMNIQNKLPINNKQLTYTEVKNNTNLKKKKIIWMLCTDLSDKSNSKHIVDAALALTHYGYKVTIITCSHVSEAYLEDLSKVRILQVGGWIPRNLYSWFQTSLYVIRSLYVSFWTVLLSNAKPKPHVLFCETSYTVLPLLKLLTDYKILYFQYKFEILKWNLPASKVILEKGWLIRQCLMNADEILVPNTVFREIFMRTMETCKIAPVVCQPHVNVGLLMKETLLQLDHISDKLQEDSYIFLVLGEYHKRSNFDLVIDAFVILLKSVAHKFHKKMKLVFCGHCSKHKEENQSYYKEVSRLVAEVAIQEHVIFSKRLSLSTKKALILTSIAVLHPVIDDIFNRSLLESMALGKPIIATNTGFANEVLDHGVTGYLIPPTPDHFAVTMSEVLFNASKSEFIGRMAMREFENTYSLEALGGRLDQMIFRHYKQF